MLVEADPFSVGVKLLGLSILIGDCIDLVDMSLSESAVRKDAARLEARQTLQAQDAFPIESLYSVTTR